MNTQEQLRDIYNKLNEINLRLVQVRQVGGNHNLLSATHPDTTPASPPTAGDLIYAAGAPPSTWQRLGIGGVNQILTVVAGAPAWADPAGGGGALFEDNFDDASLYWAWTTAGTDAARTITEAGGVLAFHVDAGTAAAFYTAAFSAPRIHIGCIGFPMAFQVKISDFTPNDDSAAGIFCIRDDAGAANVGYILERRRDDGTGQNGIFANRMGTDLASVDPMTTIPIWLRMRISTEHGRTRNTSYFDYSADGLAWTNITSDSNSGPYPGLYGLTIGMYVRSFTTTPQIDAEFDEFKQYLDGGPG
jgi:hypothetical protein